MTRSSSSSVRSVTRRSGAHQSFHTPSSAISVQRFSPDFRPHRARSHASRHRPRAACTRMRLNIECAATRRVMFIPPRALTSKRADLSAGSNRGPSAKPPLPIFLHFRITAGQRRTLVGSAQLRVPCGHVATATSGNRVPSCASRPRMRLRYRRKNQHGKGALWDEDQEASTTPHR